MGILREQELIREASLAIQTFEMKFGSGDIAWHASVDMISLLYGIVHCPVYVEVYKGSKQIESSLADCDRELFKIKPTASQSGQRHVTYAGEYMILVRPLAEDGGKKISSPIHDRKSPVGFHFRLNLIDAITDIPETADALQRYLNARHASTNESTERILPEKPDFEQAFMRPLFWKLLETRVKSILSSTLSNRNLSSTVCETPFERVWIGVKVKGDRDRGLSEDLKTFPFDYSIRWIPTDSQVEIAAALTGRDLDYVKQALESETTLGARSTMDTAASSGFLTTRIGPDKRADNVKPDLTALGLFTLKDTDFLSNCEGAIFSGDELKTLTDEANALQKMIDLGACRNEIFAKLNDAMKGDEPPLILVDIPIHVHSCAYFLVRCSFHYRDRPQSIIFLNEYITILSAQLRQLAQEAILRDLDDRIEHSLLNDTASIIGGLQATFPMPAWQIEGSKVVMTRNDPKYWKSDFDRSEDWEAFRSDISRVLQRRNLVEFASDTLPYLRQARELADRALLSRLGSPIKFAEDEYEKPAILYRRIKKGAAKEPYISGRASDFTEVYERPNRAMLISGIMIAALAYHYFEQKFRRSRFVKKLLLSSDVSGNFRWTSYCHEFKNQVLNHDPYPGDWNWPEFDQLVSENVTKPTIELSNQESDEVTQWVRNTVGMLSKRYADWNAMLKEFDNDESEAKTKLAAQMRFLHAPELAVRNTRDFLAPFRTQKRAAKKKVESNS